MDARDTTAGIVCKMGDEISDGPPAFYKGNVTPVILKKSAYSETPHPGTRGLAYMTVCRIERKKLDPTCKTPVLTPSAILAKATRSYPDIWKIVDEARTWNGSSPKLTWPDDVFLPMSAWTEIIRMLDEGPAGAPTMAQIRRVQLFAAVGAWRPTQDIVRFDPELFLSLTEQTQVECSIPMEVFHRLPAWCVYIETPGAYFLHEPTPGFFVHLEYDTENGDDELRFLVLMNDEKLLPICMHMSAGTLEEALSETARKADALNPAAADIIEKGIGMLKSEPEVRAMVNLVLYLCAYGFPMREGEASCGHPQAKKVKSGWRLFPPSKPTTRVLGKEIGDAIRKAYADRSDARQDASDGTELESAHGTHASPIPHIRHAHWHGYWTGPLNGERRFDLRWLPPIPVAMRDSGNTED